ncbi:hypothetical protein IMCC3317_07000 [Kordia antarctica]|uniref:Uncharacterized protein n=1 Tax=Kordia antarctica TaxID=1218801 RepID=A0A7L4ZHF5_9FLAO|nr:hypothetical protein [Kordia antarctica]QHI35354.1 hypothetical protein IMCC3317_07000 [Kordia antarctica]
MLKSILNIKNVQKLDKKTQAEVLGGMQYLCEDFCDPFLNARRCYTSKTDFFWQAC